MTRAWTLEMTEDWTRTRITEHDKACVLQSTVEHNVASEHFNSSLAHTTARTSQAKVGARKKSSTPLWRTMLPGHKTPWSVPPTDVIAATRKKNEKVQPKTKTQRQLSSDSSATFVRAGPRMALRPGRRTSQSAPLSPNRKILRFRKCTPQQPSQLTIRLRRDLVMACGDRCGSRCAACD